MRYTPPIHKRRNHFLIKIGIMSLQLFKRKTLNIYYYIIYKDATNSVMF